jgi:protein-S-isoprenylcysteine O-methyltransferase Ste14
MAALTSQNTPGERRSVRRGVLRWARQMIVMLVLFGALLFLLAGRIDWRNGWAYLGINFLTQLLTAVVLIPRRPDMLAERSTVREGTKSWDRILAPLIVIAGSLAIIAVAGLDARFGWSSVSGGWFWLGLFAAFAAQMFVLWSMAANAFFSGTVRIQDDRGQSVVSSGPYSLVRHPGYAGALVFNLFVPLVLGSWWTYLPALLTIALIVTRTALEDATLRAELPGYREYAARVKHRLIPGVW